MRYISAPREVDGLIGTLPEKETLGPIAGRLSCGREAVIAVFGPGRTG